MKIVAIGRAVSVQTQQREGPCAGRAKRFRGGKRLGKQGCCPRSAGRTGVAAGTLAQGPQCSPGTVFGTAVFHPRSVEDHEIAKTSCVWIPRMLHGSGKAGRP